MRLTAIVVAGTLLVASAAAAGMDKKASSPTKNRVVKETVSLTSAGLLDCSGATEVTLGNVYTGDNTGLISNVAGYSCNPWYEPGGEVVFHMFLSAPAMFSASVQGDYCDVDLAILNQCDESGGCIDVVDVEYTTPEPVSGDIYFVVDGYDESGCTFTLTLTELPLPEPTSFCDSVQVVTESGTFSGYPCSGENLVDAAACAPNGAGGLEAYYSIVMPPGGSLTATLNHAADGVLWLLGNCTEPYTCLGFVDDGIGGDPEVMTYTNSTAGDLQVFLVVDSFHPNSCGWYYLDLILTPGTVPVTPSTLGGVKWRFR